ncbi:hypothetical protein [Algibacter sp. 2305UL17-15]|uniref:hypothetical protein n=1 Tax=Algibacter sp. 2305UL17-15 TaxID=3231268 RepID=UPI00345A9D63
MMKTIVQIFGYLTVFILATNCKQKSKQDDFSWDDSTATETKKASTVLNNSKKNNDPFTFDAQEKKPVETLYNELNTEITGDPTYGVQVINGSDLGEQIHVYNTDAQILFLAASKLCKNFNFNSVFGSYRKGNLKNGKERIKIDHCCAGFIPSPYIEPMEYYLNTYYNYNAISEYRDNVFKLRDIRQSLETEKRAAFNKLLEGVDPENLVSYKLVTASIEGYDFNTKKLNIKYYVNHSQQIGRSNTKSKLTAFPKSNYRYQSSRTYQLDMAENEAKAIFEYYASLNERSKNPPFKLIVKTTYAMAIPKLQTRPYSFETKIKTIEFYKMATGYPVQHNKIAEIQINYNQKNDQNL